MKKQIAAIIILVVALGLGIYLLVNQRADQLGEEQVNSNQNYDSSSQINNSPQANSPTPVAPKDSVAVSTQTAGSEVTIDQVKLSEPGFIAIHEVTNGKPGKIIASSKLLPSGTRQDIVIKATITAGKSYVAMLHADDGDGKFDATKDQAVTSDGQMAMANFNVTK